MEQILIISGKQAVGKTRLAKELASKRSDLFKDVVILTTQEKSVSDNLENCGTPYVVELKEGNYEQVKNKIIKHYEKN